jgi:hypothetical protein
VRSVAGLIDAAQPAVSGNTMQKAINHSTGVCLREMNNSAKLTKFVKAAG